MTEDADDYCIVEYYLREMFEAQELQLSPAPDGVGLKAHIEDLFSEEHEDGTVDRMFIQFFALADIETKPKDIDLGYTLDDVRIQTGVIVADVASRTDPPEYAGEIISVAEFLETYPLSSWLQNKIDRTMDSLQQMVIPRDSWLDQASSLYNDRLPGSNGFIKPRNTC